MQQQLLIIDDSIQIHVLIKALLAEEPVDIQSATDGKTGLTLAASIQPDLVLLDVDMPVMNGFEACKRLKADRATASVPVVFLTAKSSNEEKLCGLKLGAVDYITKPFNQAELLARVRSALRTSHLIRLLEEKALIDPLTGLGNRAMFDRRLAEEVAMRVRVSSPLACIVVDVDNFKVVNDSFGHPFGDDALRKVAAVIAEHCRTEDVACRYGGDEFVIIAPHTTATDAAIFGERMLRAISQIRFPQLTEPMEISCSIGVADALDAYDRSMFHRADAAMYQSKQAGRNQVTVAPRIAEVQTRAA